VVCFSLRGDVATISIFYFSSGDEEPYDADVGVRTIENKKKSTARTINKTRSNLLEGSNKMGSTYPQRSLSV
jgi:hypothetical protein